MWNICNLFFFFFFFFGLEANSYNPWSKYYLFQKIIWNLAKYHVVFTMQLLEMLFLLTISYQLGVVVCCPPFVGNQIRVFKSCWVSSMVIKTFQFCKKRKLSPPPSLVWVRTICVMKLFPLYIWFIRIIGFFFNIVSYRVKKIFLPLSHHNQQVIYE